VDDGGEPTRLPDHSDVTIAVRPEQRHAEARHLVQQDRRRVPIVVVEANAHHRDGGVDGGEEVRIGVGRAVVRDLEHVGAKIRAGREQRALSLDLGVARQEDAYAVDHRPQDQRRVVRV
jgi:hypothetical protein